MKSRFDLEEEIMTLHSFADNLRLLAENQLSSTADADTVASALEGIAILIEMHAQRMEDTMCQVFKLNGYKTTQENELRGHKERLAAALDRLDNVSS